MNTKRLLGSVLLGLAVPAIAAHAAESSAGGHIQLQDARQDNPVTCNLPVGPAGSGQTRVYELPADGNPCASLNNKTDYIYFTDLPSATQILLTDNNTCNTTGDKDTVLKFWVKLKTTLKFTSPEQMTMQYFFSQEIGSIIKPGLLLVDRYLDGQATDAINSLSCVKVITSRATLPKPVDPIVYQEQTWVDNGYEQDSKYHCGGNRLLTGRAHYGDEFEKGESSYQCATPRQGGTRDVTLKNHKESKNLTESNSYYVCPLNTVMTGREHDGDENGDTRYTCAEAWVGDTRLEVLPDDIWHGPYPTNHHTFSCDNKVLIGRTQYGDEEGQNRYRCGLLYMPSPP